MKSTSWLEYYLWLVSNRIQVLDQKPSTPLLSLVVSLLFAFDFNILPNYYDFISGNLKSSLVCLHYSHLILFVTCPEVVASTTYYFVLDLSRKDYVLLYNKLRFIRSRSRSLLPLASSMLHRYIV